MADKKDDGDHNSILNPLTWVGDWWERKRQDGFGTGDGFGFGRNDPVSNLRQLTALGVAGYVWYDATQRGAESPITAAVIALVVSLVVLALPPFRFIFALLVPVLTVAVIIGGVWLAISYGQYIGAFD